MKIKITIEKIVLGGTMLLLSAIGGILIISYLQTRQINISTFRLSKVNEKLHWLEELLLHSIDNATRSRGYVLTGREDYADSAQHSARNMKRAADTLQYIYADDSVHHTLTDSLLEFVQAQILFTENLGNVRRQQGLVCRQNNLNFSLETVL